MNAIQQAACTLLVTASAVLGQQAGDSRTTAVTTSTQTKVVEVQTLAPDALVMSAGSVLVVRGQQKSRLESELKLSDGSILTPGGTVRRADGSSTSLADGQAITAAGKIAPAPKEVVVTPTVKTIEITPAVRP